MVRPLFPSLIVAFAAFAAPAFAGSYSLRDFTGLSVESGIQVDLTQGDFRVERTSDDDVPGLDVRVEGSTLKLGYRFSWRSFFFGRPRGPVRFQVSLPQLKNLDLGGGAGAQVRWSGGADLGVRLSGGSRVLGSLQVSRLTVQMSGGATVAVDGAANALDIEASGGSWFRSPSFLGRSSHHLKEGVRTI